jgi:L-malate glycosyltransferase
MPLQPKNATEKPRIAIMMGSLNRGGAETLLLDLIRNSQAGGIEFVLIHRKKGDLYENFVNTGVPIIQVAPFARIDPFYFFRLRSVILNNRIKLVHAHYHLDGFYSILACIGTGIKTVVTFHGFGKKKPGWYRFILRFLIKNCSNCFFVSKTQLEHYKQHYKTLSPAKTRVIYNCIDINKFFDAGPGNIRQELGLPASQILLGSVGNFNHGRDQITICKALKVLKEKQILFNFIFVGARQNHAGHLYDQCVDYCLKNGLSRQVFFLGSRQDVPVLLKQMDAFVYASKSDTFGIAVIEAMAAGVPVIVNDWKVMLEVTEKGRLGTIYPSGDYHSLAVKLAKFIENKEMFRQQAKEAAIHTGNKYNVHSYLQNLKASYTEIAGS